MKFRLTVFFTVHDWKLIIIFNGWSVFFTNADVFKMIFLDWAVHFYVDNINTHTDVVRREKIVKSNISCNYQKKENTSRFLCTECVTTPPSPTMCAIMLSFEPVIVQTYKPVSFCTHPNERNQILSQLLPSLFYLCSICTSCATVTTRASWQNQVFNVLKKHAIHGCDLFWSYGRILGKFRSYQLRWNFEIHTPIDRYMQLSHSNRTDRATIEQFSDSPTIVHHGNVFGFPVSNRLANEIGDSRLERDKWHTGTNCFPKQMCEINLKIDYKFWTHTEN